MEILNDIITFIGLSYETNKEIYNIISIIIAVISFHYIIYFIVGVFFTRKFKPANKKHKYAILIAARNEENVIGNLLDSIKKQDYPKELITTFVVADNCSDNTAKIARKKGSICYERFDDKNKTKGFALKYLFEQIEKDYGIDSFEGYFIFDADNLLRINYISKMNDAFDSGEKIITSFRNTKNFDENFIAASYGIHWIRSIRTMHRARSVFHLATNIQGTGFLFTNEIVKDGWKYTSLTEDRAMTADAVSMGYMISYQDEAEFFDEQPTNFKIALRQRLRWSKGLLLAFLESGPKLFINIFCGTKYLKVKKDNKKISKKIKESIKQRFASFDTLIHLTPFTVINLVRWIFVFVILYSCYTYIYGINDIELIQDSTFIGSLIHKLVSIKININPGYSALFIGALLTIWANLFYNLCMYFINMWTAIYILFIERKRIKKLTISKKIIDVITWPIFDIIGRYTTYFAIFMKVTWKEIPHNSKVTIEDLK